MDKIKFIKFLKEEVKNNIDAINVLREQYKTASNEDKDALMEQYQFLLGKDEAFNDIAIWLLDHTDF